MESISKKHSDRLAELKEMVSDSRTYFEENNRRYREFMQFVFNTSLDDTEMNALNEIGMPNIEFNILEAYISRLRGEFAKQQPSLTVRAADGIPVQALDKTFVEQIDVIEAHLRAIFFDGSNDMLEYNIYSDLLAGGFSAMRVYTDYINEMSMEQNIYVERVFDPTLTGFDPLARDSHKGDGRYCFEIYPMRKDDFVKEFGEDATMGMKFLQSIDGFTWSYKSDKDDIVLVCDFYEKQKKKIRIAKLTNGKTINKKDYPKLLEKWEEKGIIEQPPLIESERMTDIETIVRYRICETKVLKADETNFKHLPIVFVDGNSVQLNRTGQSYQMTRPYVYHAKGIQKLKNFAGQSMGNELQNMIQHKFAVAIESIPEDYQDAYQNVQKADVLLYNHFLDVKMPEVTLPPPREIVRTPIPPQIGETFRISDEMTQAILGSYDGSAGINRGDLSGIAFARSAIQSNNASVPYIVGYIKGLNRVAQIIVDLIPKYYRTPRSLPVLHNDGKRTYVEINKKGSIYMNYDPNLMQVKVETGVNFAMQKELSLQTILSLMQASPLFNQFMNQYGLQTLLDNIDIRGIDAIKEKAAEFERSISQQQQQQQQMQQSEIQSEQQMQQLIKAKMMKELQNPTKEQIDMMKLQKDSAVDSAKLTLEEQKINNDLLEMVSKIGAQEAQRRIQEQRIEAEQARTAVDAAVSISSHLNELRNSDESKEYNR